MTTPKAKYEITAEDKTAAAWKSALGQADSFSKKLSGMFVGVAGGGAAAIALANLAKGATSFALEMDDVADRMQIGVGSASRMVEAFEQLDGSREGLEKGFREFRLTLADAARGKDAASELFRDLRLDIEALRKQKPEEQMLSIAKAFESIHDPIERAHFAQELFSKSGSEWIAVMGKGSEEMRKYMESAVALDERGTASLERATKANIRFWDSIKKRTANTTGNLLADIFGSGDDWLDMEARMESMIEQRDDLLGIAGGRDNLTERGKARFAQMDQEIEMLRMLTQSRKDSLEAAKQYDEEMAELGRLDELDAERAQSARMAAPIIAESNRLIAQSESELLVELKKTNAEYHARWMLTQDGAAYGEQLGRQGEAKDAELDTLQKMLAEEDEMRRESVHAFVEYRADVEAKSTDESNQYQIQAQRQTQTIIAGFIRNGFEDGFRGVVISFGNMIADLLAQSAAADLAGALFGNEGNGNAGLISSFLSSFGGGKAEGGPLDQNKWYIAGEKGPEPIWGGGAGAFAAGYPSGGMGGGSAPITIHMPIDARGATVDAVKMLPQIQRAAVAEAVQQVQDMKRRGKL